MTTPSPQEAQNHPQPGFPPPGYPPPGFPPPGYGHPGYPQPGYAYQAYPQQGAGQPGVQDPTDVVGQRFAQGVVDYLLVLVPFLILYVASIVASIAAYSADSSGAVGGLVSLVGTIAWLLLPAGMWFVHAWWPHKHNGQTLAMKWLKLRIVDENGGVPTLGALSLRTVLYVADGFCFGLVGLMVMSANPRHQRLGDQVAKTLVIRAS